VFTHSEAYASHSFSSPNPGQVTRRESSGLFVSRYQLRHPLATDDYTRGVYRMPLQAALTKRYIETNPKNLRYCLVLDIDHTDALYRAFRTDLPMPSWVAESPSGKAHAGYLLANPFSTSDPDQAKVVRLAARVEEGLRRQLDADPGYSGLIMKNPVHEHWETKWGADALHTLARMAEELGSHLPRETRTRKGYRHDVAGLGRNCFLFEEARHWAYAAVRRYWEDGQEAFLHAVHDRVQLLNEQLPVPLPAVEVKALATGITRWTWAHMTPQGFQDVQKERSTKGNQVKTARAREREEAVLRLRTEGHRWQAIADTLGMSLGAAQEIGRRAKKRTEKPTLPISNMGM
jgi:hypothetical protein